MVTMFDLHAGVVLIHLYVEFVSTNCKNLMPNVVCEASGSMVSVDDDVVYREEDDDIDYMFKTQVMIIPWVIIVIKLVVEILVMKIMVRLVMVIMGTGQL